MSVEVEVAEVWAVEVQESNGQWLPIEVSMQEDDAKEIRKGWRKDAPWSKWRVTRYVPDTEGRQK